LSLSETVTSLLFRNLSKDLKQEIFRATELLSIFS